MKSEEILEAAQKNKQQGYEYEKRVSTRSNTLSLSVSLLLGGILFIVECLIKNSFNFGILAVAATGAGISALYEGIKIKKPSYIIYGIIYTAIATISISAFIYQVVLV